MNIHLKRAPLGKRQKGFTIAELAIVVLIIGIVGAIIASRFTGSGVSTARAQALSTAADSLAEMTRVIANRAGTTNVFTGSPLFNNAAHTMLDVATAGETAVAAAYDATYRNSGLAILQSLTIRTAATAAAAGTYDVQGYVVSVKNADNASFNCANAPAATANGYGCVSYAAVPVPVIEAVLQSKEGPAATVGATAKTSGPVQYTAPAGGTATMHLLVDLR